MYAALAALGIAIVVFGMQKISVSKESLRMSTTLRHLAIIMDGNRRWAKERGLQPWVGHQEGVKALKKSIQFCIKNNIPYLSLYVFSLENFKRSHEELQYLFDVIAKELVRTELNNLFAQDIKVNFIGDRTKFPQQLRQTVDDMEIKTAHNKALTLNFLFCYGGRQELTDMVRRIALDVEKGALDVSTIDESLLEKYLWTADIPDPDLIIRTGGAQRLSNFLPYQSTYSDLYFFDCYWPDFNEEHLQQAMVYYENLKRNFGA